ncbi:MAG: SRPBCC family protein, partial [Candidatus Omnitrophica bacterium]|nr:SRPBCC family protein [Candidatus Omnitrophota bacterium]
MQDSTLMYVSVSRVIPAYRWRVIRLLTKVWEFPSYIPTVKEVQVIHKTRNKIKTKWKIQVDNIPISWTEEEILALGENKIYFKALEGDLSEFKGEWKFQDCEDGTKVTVEVSLNVGIPIIKDFAESYIKKLITKNFESILMALERRLISLKYKQGNSDKIAGFGIIGHPYNLKHLETSFKMLNPDFKMPSLEFISRLFHISPSFKLYDIKKFKSKTGKEINGCFIIATFIPDMIEKDIWAIFSKVVKACKIAEKHGMGVVTLGGFTSIIAERIAYEISSEV